MAVKLIYFAWVRERIGLAEETVDLPDDVSSVRDLLQWLSARGDNYANAFAQPSVIRAAINQEHVDADTSLDGAREIALFPPVTGG